MLSFFSAALLFTATAASAAVGVSDHKEISTLLKDDPDGSIILDVRTQGEWSRGHIPGAVFMPMRSVPNNLDKLPKDKKIVVVCATGARSGAVADYLDKQGYPWVKNYSKGIVDWAKRGLPLVR